MIKSELVEKLADENPHLFQRDIENIVNAILDEVGDAMARGDRVELRGFGAFAVKNRVVTLTGDVDSQSMRRDAQTIAGSVPNVQQVVNELQVKVQKATSSM